MWLIRINNLSSYDPNITHINALINWASLLSRRYYREQDSFKENNRQGPYKLLLVHFTVNSKVKANKTYGVSSPYVVLLYPTPYWYDKASPKLWDWKLNWRVENELDYPLAFKITTQSLNVHMYFSNSLSMHAYEYNIKHLKNQVLPRRNLPV